MQTPFAQELRRFGPDADYKTPSLAQARQYCGRLARTHYENFTVASLLLPRKLLSHFHAVYAYCRWADDLGDETGGGAGALALLRWWREQLLDCYDGHVRHPVMVALAESIRLFHIPAQPFLDLLFAFEQDQILKRYRTYELLLDYCRHSANPVGRLVLHLCRACSPENGVLSDHICTALQLTNFWQDVARDLDVDRVYLPEEDRKRFGYADVDLQAHRYTPAFRDLMRFQVDRTEQLFQRGWPLVDRVNRQVRADIELFLCGGLGILRKIRQLDYNVWAARPTLRRWEKLALLGRVLVSNLWKS